MLSRKLGYLIFLAFSSCPRFRPWGLVWTLTSHGTVWQHFLQNPFILAYFSVACRLEETGTPRVELDVDKRLAHFT